MTLQFQISSSVGLAIALSTVLIVFLTWESVTHYTLSKEEVHFAAMAETVETTLRASYREYLTAKVYAISSMKRRMRTMVRDAREDLLAIESIVPASEIRERLKKRLLQNHDGERTQLVSGQFSIVLTTIEKMRRQGVPELGIDLLMVNAKQQTLFDILETLENEGEFSLWDEKNPKEDPLLLFLLPVPRKHSNYLSLRLSSDRVFAAGVRLSSLFREAEVLLLNRIEACKAIFRRFQLNDKGCLLLRDEDAVIYKRGDYRPLKGRLKEFYRRARKSGIARGSIQTSAGEYFCNVAWVPSYKWYFVIAMPVEILRKPSYELVQDLCLVGLACFIVVIPFTLYIVRRSMLPLRELRDCTSEMAALDPSSASSLDAMDTMISERLNIRRHDELGDLARTFSRMGHELTHNIRSSMEAMTVQKRLEGELNAAKDIQKGILPNFSTVQPEPFFSIASFLEPARGVGGDLYDSFTLHDGRKALVIGDVSGKGVPAALFMTMSVTLVRYTLRSGLDPAKAMTRVNALLEEHNPGSMFVTLFMAIYTPETGELLYANGGHCLPFVINPNGTCRQIENLSGPLVGAMPDLEYILFKDTLEMGDIFFTYTDGLSEAMNSRKELYGEERIAQCLSRNANLNPQALQDAVFADICAFRGDEPPSDDIAMLTMCRYDAHKN